ATLRVEHVGPQRYVVRGQLGVGSPTTVRVIFVDDPVGFARALFIEALRREGVTISASALRPPTVDLPDSGAFERLPRVASYKSPPLAETIKVTLKVSHNLYASTLPLLLAAKAGKRTLADGMAAQRKALTGLGLDLDGVSFDSGAGGGNG